MSLDKLKATNDNVFIIKDEGQKERDGFKIPEGAISKPNTGRIISVGINVNDRSIKEGKTAVFNKQAGFVIDIYDTEVTVLSQEKILGTI